MRRWKFERHWVEILGTYIRRQDRRELRLRCRSIESFWTSLRILLRG